MQLLAFPLTLQLLCFFLRVVVFKLFVVPFFALSFCVFSFCRLYFIVVVLHLCSCVTLCMVVLDGSRLFVFFAFRVFSFFFYLSWCFSFFCRCLSVLSVILHYWKCFMICVVVLHLLVITLSLFVSALSFTVFMCFIYGCFALLDL